MKTIIGYSLIGLAAGLVALAAESTPSTPASPATCTYMSNPTLGSAKGPQWIRCTPETMRTDARCRMLCEAAMRR